MENYPNYPHVYRRNNSRQDLDSLGSGGSGVGGSYYNNTVYNGSGGGYGAPVNGTNQSTAHAPGPPSSMMTSAPSKFDDLDEDEWCFQNERKRNFSNNYQNQQPVRVLQLNSQNEHAYHNRVGSGGSGSDSWTGLDSITRTVPPQVPPPHYIANPGFGGYASPVPSSCSPLPPKLCNTANAKELNKPLNNSYVDQQLLINNHQQNAAVLRQLQAKFSVSESAAASVCSAKDHSASPTTYSQLQVQPNTNTKPPLAGGGGGSGSLGLHHHSSAPATAVGATNSSNNGRNHTTNNHNHHARDNPANSGVGTAAANDEEDGWSGPLWLHGRIPLLILLVLLLFIVFLSFSAALVYFKYVPYYGSVGSSVGAGGSNGHNNKFNKGSSVLEDEPCEQTYCAFGANCVVESGRAVCRCPESCTAGYSPVCGSDDVTYANECLLRKFTCKHQKPVRVKRVGECDMVDPCADKACLFGSRCVPSADGHYAACECPTDCPNYGDTDESQNVCGSDGKLYRNKCELNRHACQLGRSITVKYLGKCDPCEDIICPSPQVCQLDEDRRPGCHCSEICSMEFNPVCASDGRTFTNECQMRQEACRSRTDLRAIYRGKCSSGVNPCETRICKGYESCAINRFGIAQCTCAMVCDPIIQPVCGSDLKTYDNFCQLTLVSCREGRNIAMAYNGVCESSSACAKTICPTGATCTERNGAPVCDCPSCPADYDPVCGSDGISYQNPCRLKLEACTTNTTIKVLYSGLCNGCEQKRCDFYSTCEFDMLGTRCVCPQNCSAASSARVCGSDGHTYENECELQRASCLQSKFITVATTGHCDLCTNVHCKYGAKCEYGVCECPTSCPAKHEPVCASNFQTFSSECELQKSACSGVHSLTLLFYGNCSEGRPLGGSVFYTSGFGTSSTAPTVAKEYSVTDYGGGSGHGHGHGHSNKPKLCESIRCDYNAMCEIAEDGFPRCTCQFNCTRPGHGQEDRSRICASDLKLYSNECEMRKEACHRQTELRPRPMELCEDVEVRPCNGEDPVKYPGTDIEINCGNGPTRSNCPQGTFCHRSPSFSKCCKKYEEKEKPAAPAPNPFGHGHEHEYGHGHGAGPVAGPGPSSSQQCSETQHGCCPDEITPALGSDYAGCPSVCGCNKVGSVAETCDPTSQECTCKPGVGGAKCDRCLPGFWGLSRIVSDGQPGCMSCQCSKFGSVRDDCEQMTGRCVCKPRVLGHKCDSCSEGEFLGPYGCTSDPINLGRTCDQVTCAYGAECEEDGNRAGCVCNLQCDDKSVSEVCASDGFTYESSCLVRLQSCRGQKPIWVVEQGPCLDSGESDGTESPTRRRWTYGVQYTEPGTDYDEPDEGGGGGGLDGINSEKSNSARWGDGLSSSGMKSTRHLPPQSNYHDNFHKNFFAHRSPTTATTMEIKSYLGDTCQSSTECVTTFSICLGFLCICREGFYEDADRIQCKPIHSHVSHISSCSNTDCPHPSTCFDHLNGSSSCTCPMGTGDPTNGCTARESPHPFFTGLSTVRLGKLAGYHKLSIEIEITPFMDYEHGIIIFSSQHANGSGDFLSLALIDGYVEFRYGLGDGPAKLRSMNRLMSGVNYHIVAKRYNRDGLLRVNDEEDVKGSSVGNMKSLNLDHGGYMGHVPLNSTKIWATVGTSLGFVGCVHKLRVGRRPIDFSESRDPLINSVDRVFQCLVIPPSYHSAHLSSSSRFTTPMNSLSEAEDENESYVPLSESLPPHSHTHAHLPNESENTSYAYANERSCPCRNNGQCWTDVAQPHSFKCVCHPEYSGKRCESKIANIQESGAMLDFRGFSYVQLPRIDSAARSIKMELWIMPRTANGLILYNGQYPGKGDYIAINILNGHIQFLFDLGSGMGNITWAKPVMLNQWLWLSASREGRSGKLQVDGEAPQTAIAPPSLSELNLELPLYLGGISDTNLLHRELGFLVPFNGVFQYMSINGITYHREISRALKERLVHKYEGPPCGSSVSAPCQNGGSCFPRLGSFTCLCPSAYAGETCELRKEVPSPIRFDGQNFLRFPRRAAKNESLNFSSDYDDFYNENFDSQLDELFGESSPLSKIMATESNEGEVSIDFDDGENEFVPFLENEYLSDRIRIQKNNRVEVIFRTTSTAAGVLIWTGSPAHEEEKRGYLGLFVVDGFPELRLDLGSSRTKAPVIIRSKVSVSDGRWHQVLIARRRRFIVFQVDGASPHRATAQPGSNALHSDGHFWIGGVPTAVLPGDIPPKYHQGFVGCVDLVRIEKRRLPLGKIAHDTGIPFCEDDD